MQYVMAPLMMLVLWFYLQVQNPLPANYMAAQSDISPRMRAIPVSRLIEV